MCEKRGFLPPLCWQSTVPSCRVESLIFPTRSTGKLRVNLPEVSLLSHSKIHEPKAFANHRSIFSFLTWWFSCWGSQKGGAAPWLRGCALSVGGKDVNTRLRPATGAKERAAWSENSCLGLTGSLGGAEELGVNPCLAGDFSQRSSHHLKAQSPKFVTVPPLEEHAMCWNHFRCRKSCVYYSRKYYMKCWSIFLFQIEIWQWCQADKEFA